MKKLILLFALIVISQSIVYSQGCLPEGITFTYQEQIDNFQANYPGCTEIEGNLEIGEIGNPTDIADLQGLNVITSILGYLKIVSNPNLTSLNGLNNLITIGGYLQISGNYNLMSVTGIENLTTVGEHILINANYDLTNLSGLENLAFIGDGFDISYNHVLKSLADFENLISIGGRLYIYENDSLTSLTGLEHLTSLGWWLMIIGNNSLTNLENLVNLTSIGGGLSISDNDALTSLMGLQNIQENSFIHLYIQQNLLLSDCDVQSICNYLASPYGIVSIHDNAPGCNSQEEVLDACENDIEENILAKLSLFPNPATNFITINIKEGITIEQAIIYNHLGQKALVAVPVNNTVDISGLRPGIYFIEVITSESRLGTKLVIK
jgi:hypothetical protein